MALRHIAHLFQYNQYDLDRCLHKPLDWFEDERRNLEREYGYQISNLGKVIYAQEESGSNGFAKP